MKESVGLASDNLACDGREILVGLRVQAVLSVLWLDANRPSQLSCRTDGATVEPSSRSPCFLFRRGARSMIRSLVLLIIYLTYMRNVSQRSSSSLEGGSLIIFGGISSGCGLPS